MPAGSSTYGPSVLNAPRPPERGRAPAHRPRAASWTTCSCRGCCTWRSCAATTRTRGSKRIDASAALARPGVVAVYTADDLGDYCRPGAAAGAAAADSRLDVSRLHAAAARAGQGPLRRRADRDGGRREPLHRRGRADRHRRRPRAARRGRRSRSGARRRTRRACTSIWRRTPPRTCVQRKGDYAARPRRRGPRRSSAAFATTAAPPRAIENRGGRRAVGRAGRRADHLGHDAGADSDPKRPRRACSACSSRRCA